MVDGRRELGLVDGFAVDLDALGVGGQMWARHGPDAVAGSLQNRGDDRAGRALAVGAGDEGAAGTGLGIAGGVEDRPHAVEAKLDAEASQAGDVLEGFGVGQDRRRSSARKVFRTSMARVIGPTPPGFGVSQPATSATAGSTSPASLPSTRLTPTSITAAPGFTISGRM